MARDVTSYHSHSDLLMFLVEMDPIRCMVARDTKKFKIDICYDSILSTNHPNFPSYTTISNNNRSIYSPIFETPTHAWEIRV